MSVTRVLDVMDSSNVSQCHYDMMKQRLTITYRGGAQYRYDRVTPKMFGELCSAESVGQYVNDVIKKLDFVKL